MMVHLRMLDVGRQGLFCGVNRVPLRDRFAAQRTVLTHRVRVLIVDPCVTRDGLRHQLRVGQRPRHAGDDLGLVRLACRRAVLHGE